MRPTPAERYAEQWHDALTDAWGVLTPTEREHARRALTVGDDDDAPASDAELLTREAGAEPPGLVAYADVDGEAVTDAVGLLAWAVASAEVSGTAWRCATRAEADAVRARLVPRMPYRLDY